MLLKIADELLAREVLDADQVKRLVKGLPLEERVPRRARRRSSDERRAASRPERPGDRARR